MRCRACDKVLKEHELYINAKTKAIEDMCTGCRGIAFRSNQHTDLETDDNEVIGQFTKYLDQHKEDW